MLGGCIKINILNNSRNKLIDMARTIAPYLGILLIGAIVSLSNIFFTNIDLTLASDSAYSYSTIDTEQAAKFMESAKDYTPVIDENPDEFEFYALIEKNDGFISKETGENSLSTQIAEKDFEYAIQKGDTLTGIAKKFDLHVASIVEKNGLSVEKFEGLKTGEKIIIPADDFSSSNEWLAQLNDKKEKERQLAIKAEQERQKKLAAQKKTKLAASKRSTVYRDSSGYDGYDGGSLSYGGSYQYVSRGYGKGHNGIDYVMPIGTPVIAAGSGKVVSITGGWGGGYGNSVLIDHGGGRTTRYAHLSSVYVGIGETVGAGQSVGASGNTGWSTGPHLHFENR